jgi:DNA-binding NarL/FixJ family response regulator
MVGTAAIVGTAGAISDVVASLLRDAGFAVEALVEVDTARVMPDLRTAGMTDTEPDVLVVVSPAPEEWERARTFTGGVVLVTERHPTDAEVVEAVMAGADAVVRAGDSPAALVTAVLTVQAGGTVLDAGQARLLAQAVRHGALQRPGRLYLTPREQAILRSAERGESVKQTARGLGIRPKTVENLQSRLFRKLGARNRAHAVVLAYRSGLLSEGQPRAS